MVVDANPSSKQSTGRTVRIVPKITLVALPTRTLVKEKSPELGKCFIVVDNHPAYLRLPSGTALGASGSSVLVNVTEMRVGYAFSPGGVGRNRRGRSRDWRHESYHCFYLEGATEDRGSSRGSPFVAVVGSSNFRPGTCVSSGVSNFDALIAYASSQKTPNQT